MIIAIAGTIFLYENDGKKLGNYPWIFSAIVIGSIIGRLIAKKVKMTAMPELVSFFNGMGGACAALISIVEFDYLFREHRILDATFFLMWFPAGHYLAIIAGNYYWQCFIYRQYDCLGKTEWKNKRLFF